MGNCTSSTIDERADGALNESAKQTSPGNHQQKPTNSQWDELRRDDEEDNMDHRRHENQHMHQQETEANLDRHGVDEGQNKGEVKKCHSSSEQEQVQPKVVLTSKDPKNARDPAYQGISVYGFRHVLLKDVKQVHGLNENSTIYQIEDLRNVDRPGVIRRKGMDVVCPMSGEKGAAYVHCLEGEDYVGDATHMLSYTWGYSVGHVLDTLEGYCESNNLDPKRTYIWICCLCNNQHKIIRDRQKGIDVPFEEFHSVFQGRVRGIGRVIAMMAPWDNPSYLKRVWCLFEIFTAMQDKECDLSIQMPSIEHQKMWDAVLTPHNDDGNNFGEFYDALAKTSVAKGEASVELDRERILAILGMMDGGHKAVDVEINQYLRGWVESTIMMLYEEEKSRYESNDLGTTEYATTCNNVAFFLNSIGQHEYSLLIHREALAIRAATLGKEHPDTAISYGNLGSTLDSMGRYEEALVEKRKALAIQEATLGEEHPFTATSHNTIGSILHRMGRYEEALVENRKALAIREASLGQDHPVTATSYDSIGSILNSMGQYEEALVENQKALAIREASLGQDHPDTATSYTSIGATLKSMGRYEEALVHHQKALAIQEATLGKDHPYTATSYYKIGSTLDSMGRYGEALVELQKALAILEAALDKDHPDTATSYNNIGFTLSNMGQYGKALVEYRKALAILEATLGKDHPSMGISYNNIGGMLDRMGRYDEALVEYRKALAIREAAFGKDHPSAATSYNNIGATLDSIGRYEEALVEYQKSLAIKEATFGKDHPSTATSYSNIGSTLQSMGRYEEALVENRKAVAIQEATVGKGHPLTAASYNNIGVTLVRLRRYEEALIELLKSYVIASTALGKEHPNTKSLRSGMLGLVQAMGHNDANRRYVIMEELEKARDHPDVKELCELLGCPDPLLLFFSTN